MVQKSGNLVIDRYWRTKVTDFYLSRLMQSQQTRPRLEADNMCWTAPEVIANGTYTAASDVYRSEPAAHADQIPVVSSSRWLDPHPDPPLQLGPMGTEKECINACRPARCHRSGPAGWACFQLMHVLGLGGS